MASGRRGHPDIEKEQFWRLVLEEHQKSARGQKIHPTHNNLPFHSLRHDRNSRSDRRWPLMYGPFGKKCPTR